MAEVATNIATVFVIPTVMTIGFLLTPFSRRRRVIPWILAPIVYVATAVVAMSVAVSVGLIAP
jgi:hypothetical protein